MACKCSKSTKLWISSILVIIIISALTLFAYTGSQDALRDSVRTGLKNTAGVMATQVNASDIANLKPGEEMSPKYMAVVNKLWTLRSMNDQIINAYILKVNPDHSITFLVDDLECPGQCFEVPVNVGYDGDTLCLHTWSKRRILVLRFPVALQKGRQKELETQELKKNPSPRVHFCRFDFDFLRNLLHYLYKEYLRQYKKSQV